MPLDHLPAEILSEILSHLPNPRHWGENGHPDLCAVALTCRYISPVAITLLYSRIKLELYWYNHRDHERAIALNNSCRENPDLVHHIHSLVLTSDNRDTTKLCNEILSQLAKSTSLVKLKLKVYDIWEYLPALFKPASNSFPCLSEVEFGFYLHEYLGDLPAEYLVKLFELPALNTLVLGVLYNNWNTTLSPKTVFKSLTELYMDESTVCFETLESILARAPNLKRLALRIPKYGVNGDPDHTCRPSSYATLLAPLANHLKTLVIDRDALYYWPHDGSRFDLSAFTNLSSLTLHSCLLFGPESSASSCPWQGEICELLPPRLCQLNVNFNGSQGLLWPSYEIIRHAELGTFDLLWKERLHQHNIDWLLDLLDRCRRGMIAIKTVKINEYRGPDNKQNLVHWGMTDLLRTAATEAGVALMIYLAVPRWFNSPENTVVPFSQLKPTLETSDRRTVNFY
ncbi:hypothetical protein M434DRAFT_10267 [Hypoxylon sp. CO27-5]|nr:hypothetical protein M434DRAFT_10267 [Hypoxylon sp. CO27-5]